MMALFLASQSPRRRELLATLGVEFKLISADIDETPLPSEDPEDYVRRLAIEKASAGLQLCDASKTAWVLGSDTSVIVDNQILGKPESKQHFVEMMALLSDREHQVLTSIALVSADQMYSDVITTSVRFIPLSTNLIDQYWETGEPQDKAGGYGIQGFGSALVAQIQGSYSAVVGLPLHETAKILSKAGLPIWNGALLL
jgi:septum formation protein